MARIHERFVDRGKIVAVRIQTCANVIEVAECGKELERSWKKASALEEIDQLPGARMDEAFAYRRRDNRASIEQEFGTCEAREVLLSERVAAVAEGTGSHSEEPPVVFITPVGLRRVPRSPPPRQQRREFREELTQTFDVIVMDDAASFGYRPLKPSPEPFFHFFPH